MKPEAKLYEVVEQLTGRSGAGILYIDDLPANVAAGAARGWQVILQTDPDKSITALRRMGLIR